jgi:hypothetical protein
MATRRLSVQVDEEVYWMAARWAADRRLTLGEYLTRLVREDAARGGRGRSDVDGTG